MLIHRIRVKQVVLHAADNATERRNVQAEYAIQIHPAQLMRHALVGAENSQEESVIARVLAKLFVNQGEVAFDQTHGPRAYAAYVRVLLEQQKELEQGRRVAGKHVFVRGLQETVLDLESFVEADRLGGRVHEDRFLEQLQQHLVEARQIHDRAVVALHELLDRQRVGGILVAKECGELGLVIEQEAVFAPARQHVQAIANPPEELLTIE